MSQGVLLLHHEDYKVIMLSADTISISAQISIDIWKTIILWELKTMMWEK